MDNEHFVMYLITVVVLYITLSANSTPGDPVPHADILDQILTSNVFDDNDPTDLIFQYLLGNITAFENATTNNTANNNTTTDNTAADEDNLDIRVLDFDNVKKIVGKAKRKYVDMRRKGEEVLVNNSTFVNMSLDLMKQSIYATRYRLEKTRRYRKALKDNAGYNIAILYGSLLEVLIKMDNMYANMLHLTWHTHFLWFLILYEKILAASVDVNNMVERMFLLDKAAAGFDEQAYYQRQ